MQLTEGRELEADVQLCLELTCQPQADEVDSPPNPAVERTSARPELVIPTSLHPRRHIWPESAKTV